MGGGAHLSNFPGVDRVGRTSNSSLAALGLRASGAPNSALCGGPAPSHRLVTRRPRAVAPAAGGCCWGLLLGAVAGGILKCQA
jgi:hypothetical protein